MNAPIDSFPADQPESVSGITFVQLTELTHSTTPRRAFLVAGIYTYVRDGVITTAGLRGSRTAELIERIGAVNQTRDEVTRLFVQNPNR